MLPKVGPAVALKLAKLGIYTVRDLLFHWPRTWLDATTPVPIATIAQDQTVVIEGRLSQLRYDPPIAKRRPKITALITDEAGDTVPVVWHNQSYLRRVLANGQRWLFLGKTVWNWQRRALELSNPQRLDEQAVLAVYPETAGISSAFLRSTVGHALARVAMPDPLGPAQAVSFADAVRLMHRPPRLAEVAAARRRLALDELAMVQYVLREQRLATTNLAPAIAPALPRLQALVAGLPFQLTRDQRRISWDIIRALNSPVAVRHVLQGDVGTGKTIVALLVAVSVLEAGYDVCWMAPTQLLARQLADRLRALMGSLPFDCDLVTAAEKPAIHHRPTVYVGTHALLSMVPRQLGLVVIDEQHRFGVKQQDSLGAGNCHVLTMTATPIPRALLLALYGERGSSQLVERPALQQPVATVALPSSQREQVAAALVEAVGRGEQGFIITPRIEAGEDPFAPFPSLKAVLQRYQRAAPAVRFAPYHGNLSATEQQATMERFLSGAIDVLVATSIVEVGLDVPKATQMVIEQANWFGLAQLHQLRGRVGRGSRPATCTVLYDDEQSDRIRAFVSTADGFALATMDLKLRGPGDLLGALQSGWGRLRLADPTDTELAAQARELAEAIALAPVETVQSWLAMYRGEEADAGAS